MRELMHCGGEKTNPEAHRKKEGDREEGRVILVGSPNVGKSAIFNLLTGANVTVSNYPGTTVGIDRGKMRLGEMDLAVIDTPGMYSLMPVTEEERIGKLILMEEGNSTVVHVTDAKNLERSLPFTLQLLEAGLTVILVLNMMDEAEKRGLVINHEKLSERLGIPVIPMVAVKKKGLEELKDAINSTERERRRKDEKKDRSSKEQTPPVKYFHRLEEGIEKIARLIHTQHNFSVRSISLLFLEGDKDTSQLLKNTENERYEELASLKKEIADSFADPISYTVKLTLRRKAREVVRGCQSSHREKEEVTFQERLSALMTRPRTGLPILFLVLYVGFYQVVGVFGAGVLVGLIEEDIFGKVINPFLIDYMHNNIGYAPLEELLVGEYGVFTMGLTYAVAIVMPIVGTFFLVFSIIEDTGYLPRLALLLDRSFKRIGLNGRAVIPLVLGFGCDTMATIVTRTLETKRERIIATLLLALGIPCSAQLGVIMGILSHNSLSLILWAVVITANMLLVGTLTARFLPGDRPTFYMELPPLRMPSLTSVLKKTWTRMVWYFKEVLPIFLYVSVMIWFLDLVGIFSLIIAGMRPVVGSIGLPDDAAVVFLIGFFRRDYGAAGLYDIQNALTGVQMLVAAVTLTLFVPCIAQFIIMMKERGPKMAVAMFLFVMLYAFFIGFLLNSILTALGVVL